MGIGCKLIPISFLILSLFLFPALFEKSMDESSAHFLGSKSTFLISLLWMSFVAPIYEEIIFDGAFLKNKIFKIVSYVGLLFFTLKFNLSPYSLFFLCFFYLFSYLNYKSSGSIRKYKTLMIIFNSLLFSMIHLNIHHLSAVSPISLFSRFGGHLLALWLVLNYKLIYAIFFHILWNSSLAVILFFSADKTNVENKTETLENEIVKMEYKKANNFTSMSMSFSDDYYWVLSSSKISDLMSIKFINKDSILNNYDINSQRYDFKITIKDTSAVENRILIQNHILNLMAKDSLVVKK